MTDSAKHEFVGIFTPIPNGKVLAALCQLNGAGGQVLENAAGTLAVLDTPDLAAGETAGKAVSLYARGLQIAVLDRRDGHLTVNVYVNGQHVKAVPGGLALADAPGVVLSLATGAQTVDEIAATHPEKVFSSRGSRWGAFWALRRLGREARRQARTRA